MNKSDSERISTILEKKGYKPTLNIKRADLIVVNMCSVRQSAVDRVYGKIRDFTKFKIKNPKLKTVLTGCILKKDEIKFRKIFDEIWVNKNYFRAKRGNKVLAKRGSYFDVSPKCQNKPLVYIPISNGCNNFCTYCVVPYTRGSLICRDHKAVLKEVKNAIKKSYKEIWLLGQNVNDYHSPADSSINFPELLKMVNNIPGDFQIRFMSPHPKNFSDKLIGVMAESKKVAKYLNLPVQSGDNQILKKMNRPYTVQQYKNLIKKIRKKIPDVNLSTDIIVGFPGETKKQFQNTVKLFKEIKFNIAYISKYSPRSGTPSFKLKDNVPKREKERRWKILNDTIHPVKSCKAGPDNNREFNRIKNKRKK